MFSISCLESTNTKCQRSQFWRPKQVLWHSHVTVAHLFFRLASFPGSLFSGRFPGCRHPEVIAYGYLGTVDGDSEDGILRPASVYSPKKRIVAIAPKETGTHIPFSCANCIVR